MGKQEIIERECVKCGKSYCAPPALSREDNLTLICPDCGVREGLESIGVGIEEQDHILGLIHQYENKQ